MYKLSCRYRLVVRTSGSHPGNRGSIPRSGTFFKKIKKHPDWVNYIYKLIIILIKKGAPGTGY